MTTVLEALRASHRQVEKLFRTVHDMIAIGRLELAHTLFRRLSFALIATTRAKHAVVYPRLAREPYLADEVAQALREHAEIERLVDLLRIGRLDDTEWCAAVAELGQVVADLADREEYTLFPMARLSLTQETLLEMAKDFVARARLAAPSAGASITYDPPQPEPPILMTVSVKAA